MLRNVGFLLKLAKLATLIEKKIFQLGRSILELAHF